jgi:hypothetical protein
MAAIHAMFSLLHSLLLLSLASSLVGALSPISVKGTRLYDNDGNQFFIKGTLTFAPRYILCHLSLTWRTRHAGVSYIPRSSGSDPLLDTRQCQIDAAVMRKASINTVYVYVVDSQQSHDGCMKAFADQGIYVWLLLGDFPRATGSVRTIRNSCEGVCKT